MFSRRKLLAALRSLVDVGKDRKSPRCPYIKLTHPAQRSAGAAKSAQSALMTHGPFSPDIPERRRLGTSLKSEGLCASNARQNCQQCPTLPTCRALSCTDLPGRSPVYFERGVEEM